MLFTKSFTVKTTHDEDSPLIDTIKLAHGIITWVSVSMPPGCHGLVYCKLKHHEHTIFPSIEDMYIFADTYPVEWNEYYEMYHEPYELKFVGWVCKTKYDHVVTIRIAVLPRKAILGLAVVDAIKALFGMLSPKRIFTRTREEVENNA